LRTADGFQFAEGYLSPYFITDPERMETLLEDPYILVYENKINSVRQLAGASGGGVLEQIARSGKAFLIIAEDVEGEALATLVVNKLRGVLVCCAVKSPGLGARRNALLEDLAILTGAKVVSEGTGNKLEDVTLDDLGRARRVTVDKNSTTLIDCAGSKKALQDRIEQLRAQIEQTTPAYDREKLTERLAKLEGGVVIITVGAATETELKEKKARVEDALHSTRAAMEEGIVPGGGIALLRAAEALGAVMLAGDEQVGVNIVKRACEEPLRQIAANAGYEGDTVIEEINKSANRNYGFNAARGRYEDLLDSGVIDAAKVTRSALQNASSISALMLTTEPMVTEVPPREVIIDGRAGASRKTELLRFTGEAKITRDFFLSSNEQSDDRKLALRSENTFTVAPPLGATHAGPKPGATRNLASSNKQSHVQNGTPGGGGGEGSGGGGGRDSGGDDSPPPPERRINFWISEREQEPFRVLNIGDKYTGNFRVGVPVKANLFTGPGSTIPPGDVPASGLPTHWVMIATNVELGTVDQSREITLSRTSGELFDSARFDLLVPKFTDSTTIRLTLRPLAEPATLTVLIHVNDKIYRELKADLRVSESATVPAAPAPCASITQDLPHAPLDLINTRTTRKWTTPPGVITLTVFTQGKAILLGTARGQYFSGDIVSLGTRKEELEQPVGLLQKSAESFRAKHGDYLNDIAPQNLLYRLSQHHPGDDWGQLPDFADPPHQSKWQTVSVSDELFKLAFYGHKLYNVLFPRNVPPLRDLLDQLEPGQRVNINWRSDSGGDWVPHIPWELLYVDDPSANEAVDPTRFWGLRFRIGYTTYRPGNAMMSLGAPKDTWCSTLLFYGNAANEPATEEAKWQRKTWGSWSNQWIVPMGAKGATPKAEIVAELKRPSQRAGVLYLFCHYSLNAKNVPVLRFGTDSDNPDDILDETELGTTEFRTHPLVFANACMTGAAGVHAVNELEKAFFDRGCRAFIGTESKVPVQMASRFAAAFFWFFLRLVDRDPMAGGEAMSQARLLLWTHYKNIGGLLYSYVNQYDLYFAGAEELVQIQRS
jgi:hypothetical protein